MSIKDQLLEAEKTAQKKPLGVVARSKKVKHEVLFLPLVCFGVVLLSILITFSSNEDEKRLAELEVNGNLSKPEIEEYCQLRHKIVDEAIEDCWERVQDSRRKGSSKDARKSNPDKIFSLEQQIDSLQKLKSQPRNPPYTKTEKREIQRQIQHLRLQKKKSEPHGKSGKRK